MKIRLKTNIHLRYMKKIENIKTSWNYSSLAKYYDFRPDYSEKLIKKILKKIKCKDNYPVADIGAGTGKLTKFLCKNKLIVHAVEPNDNMRYFGKKNTKSFKNLNWSTGTGEKSLLHSNSIYCIFYGSSFNTIDYKEALKEIKRVLIKKGYFCCMWNYRYLNDFHQKEIEKIIKSFIPNYNYGDRRIDYKKFLIKEDFLADVEKVNQRFSVEINKNNFIKAWESHGTLKRNCRNLNQFNEVIKEIKKYVKSLKNENIKVPYDNVAYIAKLK